MSVAEEDGWFCFVSVCLSCCCCCCFLQLLGGLSKFYFILTKYHVFRALKHLPAASQVTWGIDACSQGPQKL